MIDEIWNRIRSTNFEISSYGRIRKGDKIYLGYIMKNGYRMFDILKTRKEYIHRLVAEAFIPNPNKKRTVNHKDLDKLNNHVDNLEWATDKENINHARSIYGNYNAIGEQNGKSKLTEAQAKEIKQYLRDGVPQRTIAKMYGISRGPISGIALGILWKHVE